jgi:membrane protease YdiL (CAAX protease family)
MEKKNYELFCLVAKVQLVEKTEIYVTSIIAIIIFFVFNELLFLIAIIYFGINFREVKKLFEADKIIKSIISFIIFIPLLFLISFIIQYVLPEYKQQEIVLNFKSTLIEDKGILLHVLVIAPIVEEVIFRGCIYRILKSKIPIIFATIINSTLFALIHYNVLSYILLFVLSIFLTYIYERNGSIICPIIIHSLFNLMMSILIVFGN